ncbi:MAG TPA: hypothetical protein DEQ02_09070, partial [Ruminococcaceae bacterium]|nr:hypothetical protein [Oscillospiraceae bacterium]
MTEAANFAGTAILTFGRYSSEGSDRSAAAGDYYLSASEQTLAAQVIAAGFENVVVLFNVGGMIDTSWFVDNNGIDAALMAWQSGMEGGNVMADILCGDVNPSGKLTDTLAKAYTDYPGSSNFQTGTYVDYEEDIYVGYRYFETLPGMAERVNYEFGYGLSYTEFEISGITARQDGENIAVSATVKNIGTKYAGKEVVQAYYSAPQGVLGKPAKELGTYAKTRLLAPGESQTLEMSFPIDRMASYDDTGRLDDGAAEACYVMEAGDYKFFVGNSVRNVTQTAYIYTLGDYVITERLSHQAVPGMLQKRLLADGSYESLNADIPYVEYYDVAAAGRTKIEMEAFQRAHPEIAVERFLYPNGDRGYCAAYFNTVGNWVEYDLNVEQAGYYSVNLSAANAYAEVTNAFGVYVGGEQQPGISINLPNTGNSELGQWYNFVEVPAFKIYLPEGRCVLRFANNKTGVGNLDYIALERTEIPPNYVIPVPAVGSATFESVNTAFQHADVRTESFVENGVTKTCLAYMNTVGNWVSYFLDVETAGTYDLILRAANGRAAVSDFISLELDDTALPSVSITCPQTGDGSGAGQWYNFVDLDPVSVTLPAGRHYFKIVSRSDRFPNIN